MKKILSVVLVCIMLLGVLPVAYAADTDRISSVSLIKHGNVIMKIGESYAYVRGELKSMPSPYEQSGHVYLPLRTMADFINTRVEWNNKKKTATWFYGIYEYVFRPGEDTFTRYERVKDTTETYSMGAPAVIGKGGSLYIPFEKLCEVTDLRFFKFDSGIIVFGTKEAKYEPGDYTSDDRKFTESLFAADKTPDSVEKIFYVDPENGRDSYDGSLGYPFRNLSVAKEEVRKYKEANGQNGDIVVYLRGGSYYLNEPLEFDDKDGGLSGYKVIWSAYPGETVIMNGGQSLKNWEKVDDKIYRSYIGSGKSVKTFYEGENFALEARHPNTGYNTVIAAKSGASKTEFIFKDQDIPEISDPTKLTWSGWPGGPSGHWNWFHQQCAVTGINYKTKTVNITGKGISYVLGSGSRYYVKGAYELLDYPGEFWYSIGDGYLYYYPIADNIEEAELILPISNIITVKGTDAEHLAENIEFRNLNLRNCADSIIKIQQAANVHIIGCEVRNSGGAGIAFSSMTPATPVQRLLGIRIENCGIFNTGGTGISMSGTPHPDDILAKYHVLKNNRIDKVGLITHSAEGIYMFSVGYSLVANNVISDGGRFGIRLGGTAASKGYFTSPAWGSALDNATEEYLLEENASRNNVIEYNTVTRVMDDSQDGGAIYAYEGGLNNIIRNNYMYDNSIAVGGMNVLYSDNKNPGIAMYDNVVYNNQTWNAGGYIASAISVNVGTKNAKVFNNLSVSNPADLSTKKESMSIYYYFPNNALDGLWSSDMGHWTKNISYDNGTNIFPIRAGEQSDKKPFGLLDNNMYYDNNGSAFSSFGVYDEKGMKTFLNNSWEQHSLFDTDPLFLNRKDDDLRLHYTSPAYRILYRDIDFNIGLTDGYTLKSGDSIEHMYVNIIDSDTDGFTALNSGESAKLDVVLKDYNGYVIRDASVSYSSDNPSVATVGSDGVIRAHSKGVARVSVTASKGDKTRVRTVDVLVDDTVKALNADSTLALTDIGEKGTVRHWYTTEFGRQIPSGNVTYSSSDESIVTVNSNGLYETKALGTATIEVTDVSTGLKAKTEITVKDGLFANFDMETPNTLLKMGEQAVITISTADEEGNPIEIPAEAVKATSSDESILEIEQKSAAEYVLTGKSAGTSSIRIEVDCDGTIRSASKNFYVLDANGKEDTSWKHSNYGFWDAEGTIPTEGSFEIYDSGIFNLKTNGYNFWGTSDQGTFGYKKITLDPDNPVADIILKFDVSPSEATIPGIGANKAAFGAMLRGSDTADSPDIHFRWEAAGSILMTYRDAKGGESGYSKGNSFSSPPELRLFYDGGGVRAYYRQSSDLPWELYSTHNLKLEGNTILLGIGAYSQNGDAEGKPTFVEMLGSAQIRVGDEVDLSDIGYDIANAG